MIYLSAAAFCGLLFVQCLTRAALTTQKGERTQKTLEMTNRGGWIHFFLYSVKSVVVLLFLPDLIHQDDVT